eukprot:TRINITY_DN48024_c0_g1_i1.p1 TRINITY_DN48024_c0_g1~~TRINITY_DN48024_c0_g1_i1.p1  ORF type:complete len:355 (+),score=44.86 TRINITY_DN48024_c0_g1_i1:60-1067(+)
MAQEVLAGLGEKTCRICFEGGGELISPCSCSGTSKWIHRSCLNHWRTSGFNPRSLTNCCECGYQYQLEVRRILETHREERRHRFLRETFKHTLRWLVLTQVLIIAFAMLIKLFDNKNGLVSWLPFEHVVRISGYFPSLGHYALTYYVAGLIVFMLLFGSMICWMALFGAPHRDCGVCAEGANLLCESCFEVVSCRTCPIFGVRTLQILLLSRAGPEALIGVLALFAVLLFLLGVVVAVIVLVLILQRACQQYMRLHEMGVLAEEYVVKDLSASTKLHDDVEQQDMDKAATTDASAEQSQLDIQKMVERDLEAVFGTGVARHSVDYGTMANSPGNV